MFDSSRLTTWPIVTEGDRAAVLDALDPQKIVEKTAIRRFSQAVKDYFLEHADPGLAERIKEELYVLPLSRCTHAIHVALAAVGVGPGDEVIVPAFGFSGTSHPVLWLGAKPVFADTEYLTGNLAAEEMSRHITDKTKAVLLVHMHGIPANMGNFKHYLSSKVAIIEDSCQAHGSKRGPWLAGTYGTMAAFSTNPVKPVPSTSGGFLVVYGRQLYERAAHLAYYGELSEQEDKTYRVNEVGYAYSMSHLDAALATSQLSRLDLNNQMAMDNADILETTLAPLVEKKLIRTPNGSWLRETSICTWHKYRILITRPYIDMWELVGYLRARGLPVHRWAIETIPESGIYPHEDPLKYPNAWELAHKSFCVLTEHQPLAAQGVSVIRDYATALKTALLEYLDESR